MCEIQMYVAHVCMCVLVHGGAEEVVLCVNTNQTFSRPPEPIIHHPASGIRHRRELLLLGAGSIGVAFFNGNANNFIAHSLSETYFIEHSMSCALIFSFLTILLVPPVGVEGTIARCQANCGSADRR